MEAAATESIVNEPAALRASTLAEAFRITAAERADEVAIRTRQDEFAITWGELRASTPSLEVSPGSAFSAATRSR